MRPQRVVDGMVDWLPFHLFSWQPHGAVFYGTRVEFMIYGSVFMLSSYSSRTNCRCTGVPLMGTGFCRMDELCGSEDENPFN